MFLTLLLVSLEYRALPLPLPRILPQARQLLSALAYIHDPTHLLAHLLLKLPNVLLDENYRG
jgi:serine/threonine protein kinase